MVVEQSTLSLSRNRSGPTLGTPLPPARPSLPSTRASKTEPSPSSASSPSATLSTPLNAYTSHIPTSPRTPPPLPLSRRRSSPRCATRTASESSSSIELSEEHQWPRPQDRSSGLRCSIFRGTPLGTFTSSEWRRSTGSSFAREGSATRESCRARLGSRMWI